MTRVAHAGVGGWGKNVVRVVGELAELAWICDTDAERLAEFGSRYPEARTTRAFADLLADEEVDAVVVATPVPTHYELAHDPDDVLAPPADARVGDVGQSFQTFSLVMPARPVALRRSTTSCASSTSFA